MSDTTISFEEFLDLCEEAGISTDNAEVLEQDYRAGKALADVTDALISDQETHPAPYTMEEALKEMDLALTMIEEAGAGTELGYGAAAVRKQAVKAAVLAIRFIAENTHDEGKN